MHKHPSREDTLEADLGFCLAFFLFLYIYYNNTWTFIYDKLFSYANDLQIVRVLSALCLLRIWIFAPFFFYSAMSRLAGWLFTRSVNCCTLLLFSLPLLLFLLLLAVLWLFFVFALKCVTHFICNVSEDREREEVLCVVADKLPPTKTKQDNNGRGVTH